MRQHAKAFTDAMTGNPQAYALVIDACNLVEASAMHFETGIANELLAFEPLSQTLVWTVEKFFPVYCMQRQRGNAANYYPYTMKLYARWSQRLATSGLKAQQEALAEAVAKAEKGGAPRPLLGA